MMGLTDKEMEVFNAIGECLRGYRGFMNTPIGGLSAKQATDLQVRLFKVVDAENPVHPHAEKSEKTVKDAERETANAKLKRRWEVACEMFPIGTVVRLRASPPHFRFVVAHTPFINWGDLRVRIARIAEGKYYEADVHPAILELVTGETEKQEKQENAE